MAFIKKEALIPYLDAYKKIYEVQEQSESGRPFIDVNEEYKRDIARRSLEALNTNSWIESEIGQGIIGDNAIRAVQRNYNLIGRYQVSAFINRVKESNKEAERVLFDLYHEKKEQDCFEKLCELFGRKYDLISYLYFIIDPNRYLPLRSSIFDDVFNKLEIDFQLTGRCSWRNYQEFIDILSEVRDYMREYYKWEDIDLIDAHSFLWSLNPNGALSKEDAYDNYLKVGTEVVHRLYGKGTVLKISGNDIYVKFNVGQRIFPYPEAFTKEYLLICQ